MRRTIVALSLAASLFGCILGREGGNDSKLSFVANKGDVVMKYYGGGRPDSLAFYEHVFRDNNDRPRVVVCSQWNTKEELPADFNGVFVALSAEQAGIPGWVDLKRTLYIGTSQTTGAAESIYTPYVSLGFTERKYSPMQLLKAPTYSPRPYFAAYMAKNCAPDRERYFDSLVEFARRNQLGEVHALGACHGTHPETSRPSSASSRGSGNYLDSVVKAFADYRYALVFENEIADGYVTEKPANALLAGAIPLYQGSERINQIFNPKSFVLVPPGSSPEAALGPFLKNRNIAVELATAPGIESDEKLYLFSWHKDAAQYLRGKGKRTLQDEIYERIAKLAK